MMNVAGISSTQEGPKLDFVFLCHQECAAKNSLFLVQSVKVPSNPVGECSKVTVGAPVIFRLEKWGCVRFRTEVLLVCLCTQDQFTASFYIMLTSL